MSKYCLLILVSLVLSARASVLPFSENFDTLTLGSIDNTKPGWVSLAGTNNIQSDVIAGGSQALEIKSGVVQHALSNTGGGTSVWVSFQARITAAPSEAPVVTNPNTSVAFFINTNLNIVVYSNQIPIPLSASVQTNTWTRFDVYCDYGSLTWKLNVDGVSVASNLVLFSTNQQIDSLVIANESSASAYFDELVVETTDDTNNNGIPDWWEQCHFGGITNAPSGVVTNGMTCEQMYIAGLEPSVADDIPKLDPTDRKKINWIRKTGRKYDIYWSSNLTSGFTFIQTATGSEFQDTATNRTARPAGFYKIKVSR
jgi:hypothetical protein